MVFVMGMLLENIVNGSTLKTLKLMNILFNSIDILGIRQKLCRLCFKGAEMDLVLNFSG